MDPWTPTFVFLSYFVSELYVVVLHDDDSDTDYFADTAVYDNRSPVYFDSLDFTKFSTQFI